MQKILKLNFFFLILIVVFIGLNNLCFAQNVNNSYLNSITSLLGNTKNNKNDIYKIPVKNNGIILFYIGSSDKLNGKNRALEIITITNEIVSSSDKSIRIDIDKDKNIYHLKLDGELVTTITENDVKVNNITPRKLAHRWKSALDNIIRQNEKIIKEKGPSNPLNDSMLAIIILVLSIIIVEFSSKQLKSVTTFLIKTGFENFNSLFAQTYKTNTQIETQQKKSEEETREKLDRISSELNNLIKYITKFIEIVIFLIFINYILYTIPFTYDYIKNITNFEISILDIIQETITDWISSAETWERFGRILIIIMGSSIILWLINTIGITVENLIQAIVSGYSNKEKRIQTISKIIRTTLKLIIIVIATIMVLYEIGIDITPIIAGVGIVGIAISFGAQSLVKDFINGFFILIEDQFGIGDIVIIGDKDGVVENMTLRITVLRDISGRVHIIPNGQISQVSVSTKEWARANLDIRVAYSENVDKTMGIIQDVADNLYLEHQDKIIAKATILGVNEISGESITIKLTIDTKPGQQWFIEREFKRRIKIAFDEHKVSMAVSAIHFQNKI